MEHRVSYKVYYEDTDSLGVVYYANYLKYLERGRTEYIDQMGRPIQAWNREGYLFVVYAVNMTFKRPAVLGDQVEVVSAVRLTSGYRARFTQRIERQGELLVEAEVDVVCLDEQRRLRRFPALESLLKNQ